MSNLRDHTRAGNNQIHFSNRLRLLIRVIIMFPRLTFSQKFKINNKK